MKLKTQIGYGLLLAVALGTVGCGQSDPLANVPPENKAPDPTKLGDDPEYVKQMGGAKKK